MADFYDDERYQNEDRRMRAADRTRYTGRLEPSPTGTYYNAARYRALSPAQRRIAQRNLDRVYAEDLAFNRVANPNYQPEQDTGYSTAAPFGSGRATPATTQAYARTYGRQVGNGLTQFETPSGGSITYRPTGRNLTGGVPGGGARPLSSADNRPNPATSYALGYYGEPGAMASKSQQTPYERSYLAGYNVPGVVRPESPGLGYMAGAGIAAAMPAVNRFLMNTGSAIANVFRGSPNPPPVSNFYAYNPSPVPTQPRRYFDF